MYMGGFCKGVMMVIVYASPVEDPIIHKLFFLPAEISREAHISIPFNNMPSQRAM